MSSVRIQFSLYQKPVKDLVDYDGSVQSPALPVRFPWHVNNLQVERYPRPASPLPGRINRRWALAKRPKGMVSEENFKWVEGPVPSLAEGQVLVRNLWLSLDPTQILFTYEESGENTIPLGGVMRCISSGQVIESRHPGFDPGDIVQGVVRVGGLHHHR